LQQAIRNVWPTFACIDENADNTELTFSQGLQMIQLSAKLQPLPQPKSGVRLQDGELHVWRITLDQTAAKVDLLHKQLSEAEQVRASKFFREEQAHHFVVCRAALRQIVSRYQNCRPEEIEFDYSEHGKPKLAKSGDIDLRFNLSHSGSMAVVAICLGEDIGIDIEREREVRSFDRMLERCLSDCERHEISSLHKTDQQKQFLRFWTHKEAYLKTIGVGLRHPLDRVTLDLVAPEARKVVNHFRLFPQFANIRLTELVPCEGFVGAVGSTHADHPEFKTFAWVSSPLA